MCAWQPPRDYENRPVTILGAGVLGRRIGANSKIYTVVSKLICVAACWTAAGYSVVIRDPSEQACQDALSYVGRELGTYSALTNREPGKLQATEDFVAAVKDSWLVIEAVPEKLEIKESTFLDLEKHAPEDCIFGSNSSSFKSSELVVRLQDATRQRCLNTHGRTTPELMDFLFDRHREAGLHPIIAWKESTGFVFNRIWAAIKRETLQVLQEGVSTPAEIDRVFKEMYGARDGPCHMMDQVGLDTVAHIEEHYIKERKLPREHVDWLDDHYVKPGKLGNKSNKGGLYDKPKPGSQTVLYFLNLGVAEKLDNKLSMEQITHRGQVLSLNVSEGGPPVELVGKEYVFYPCNVCWTSRS
nr:3-hydroxyacyl-coa dehydrogenase-like protein lam1 [Quercus suber]